MQASWQQEIPIQNIAEPLDAKPSTSAHGSTSGGGQSLTAVLERLQSRFVPVESKALQPQPKPSLPSMPSKPPERKPQPFTARDKQELTVLLGQIATMQKAFGKSATDLESLVEGYCFLLDKFTMQEIRAAMKTYMLAREDIPSPANIAQIIDPSLAPLSQAVYIRLTQKAVPGNPYSLTAEERRYIERFEANELRKLTPGTV